MAQVRRRSCGAMCSRPRRFAHSRTTHHTTFSEIPRPQHEPCRLTARKIRSCCKYPPAEPVALRLLAPQTGLFATVRSKSKNKSKCLVLLSSLPKHRQFEGEHTPGILKVLLPPRQSRGISLLELGSGMVRGRTGKCGSWLPTRDSNPNMLLQRQLSYH